MRTLRWSMLSGVMETAQKVVLTIPVETLWREDGVAVSKRVGSISSAEIADLLRAGPVRFVIADVGRPLEWIPLSQCFEYWKAKVKHNICRPEEKRPLDIYPDWYCFSASLWKDATESITQAIVLLEKHH